MHPISARLRRAQAQWRYIGQERPSFALAPAPGQESVWDYPRPPRVVPDTREVVIRLGEHEIARTHRALRLLETASPPTFYLPRADVVAAFIESAPGASMCEWKGEARYGSVVVPGRRLERVVWWYPDPYAEYAGLRDHLAFYPAPLECRVDGTRVEPQPGRFYAGWITPELVGPFKGAAGSGGW